MTFAGKVVANNPDVLLNILCNRKGQMLIIGKDYKCGSQFANLKMMEGGG